MLKKLLIVVAILVVIAFGGLGYFANKLDTVIKEHDPEFRQYITMTLEEQNAYVEKNLGDFISYMMKLQGNEANTAQILEKLKSDPEAFKAGIDMGRAVVASFILANEDILKDLSAEVHNKLQEESSQLEARQNKYNEFLKKYMNQQE